MATNGVDAAAAHEVPICSELPGAELDPGPPIRAEPVAEGLVVPWAVDFAPDGRIFLTERPGRIRTIEQGVLVEEPWARLDVYAEGEAGLLGIALAPDFEVTGHVFVAGTFHAPAPGTEDIREIDRIYLQAGLSPGSAPQPQHPGAEVRVYRLTDQNGRGEDRTLIAAGIPAARIQVGAAVAFGPDSLLYVSTGDAVQPERAQDTASLAGKLLRYLPDGAIPEDNPFEGSPVFALGLRNVQGIDWHPDTEDLFVSEHGPSGLPTEGGRTGEDELNRIVPRGNYGWPVAAGLSDDERFIPPLSEWSPAIAPSGLAIYTGDELPWFGNVFLGALRGEHLRRIVIEEARELDSGWRLVCEDALFEGEFGRIRGVRMGVDGSLYFTTSNGDGRGDPAPGADRLLRVVPAEP